MSLPPMVSDTRSVVGVSASNCGGTGPRNVVWLPSKSSATAAEHVTSRNSSTPRVAASTLGQFRVDRRQPRCSTSWSGISGPAAAESPSATYSVKRGAADAVPVIAVIDNAANSSGSSLRMVIS
jgi:hypothetical protein